MKKRDLVELWKLMDQYKGVKNIKFAYFLARNRKQLQPEIESLEEAIVPSETYKAYDNERVNLAQFYSDKLHLVVLSVNLIMRRGGNVIYEPQ